MSVGVAIWLVTSQGVPDPRREVHEYLTRNGFTAEEIAGFDNGQAVARAATSGSEEVVVIAAVKIRAPRDRVLDYYGRYLSYVDGTVTLAFGRINTPPAEADVKALAFDPDEVGDLRSCRPGDCDSG